MDSTGSPRPARIERRRVRNFRALRDVEFRNMRPLTALRADEVRVLWRDEQGYTHSERAVDRRGVSEFTTEGALLGDLWMEGHLGVGDPLSQRISMASP